VSAWKELRERTQREMALAGNHWDAIGKHLDAYEAAFAHELAERIRSLRDGADYAPDSVEYKHMSGSADWIDPEVSK
jgi:hypothetical protein